MLCLSGGRWCVSGRLARWTIAASCRCHSGSGRSLQLSSYLRRVIFCMLQLATAYIPARLFLQSPPGIQLKAPSYIYYLKLKCYSRAVSR